MAIHKIQPDFKAVAARMGENCTPRAVQEQLKKLRKLAANQEDGAGGHSAPSKGLLGGTAGESASSSKRKGAAAGGKGANKKRKVEVKDDGGMANVKDEKGDRDSEMRDGLQGSETDEEGETIKEENPEDGI